MAEKADPAIIENIPSVAGGISGIGSAQAPFVYFENAPFYGLLNGVGQVTLEAGESSESTQPASPFWIR